jgi:hypothetical protein
MIIGISGKIGSGKEKEVEIWKDCIDNTNYQISNHGRVRSKDKQVSGRNNSIATKKGKILSPANFNGYLGVKFSEHSGTTTALIHILVAKAFIPNPENKCCVNHKYGDKHNNYYKDLEWSTYSENMYHASKTGLTKTGEKHYNSKLSNEQVIEIKEKYTTGNYSHSSLGKEYGVTKQNITMILNNKSRKQ